MYLQMEELERKGNQSRGGRGNQGQFNGNNGQSDFHQGGQQYGNNSDRGGNNNRGQQYGQNRNNYNSNNYQGQQYQQQGNQGYNNNNAYRNQSPRDFTPNPRNFTPNQPRNDYPRNNYNNNNQNANFRDNGNASFGQGQQNRNYNTNYGNRGGHNQNYGPRNNDRNFGYDDGQNQGPREQRSSQRSYINTDYDDELAENGFVPNQPYQQPEPQPYQAQPQRNNYQNRQPRNNYQQNNSFGGQNQRGRQNFSEGGGNQRRQYRNFDRDDAPIKEVSQQEMLYKLSQNRNILVQNYKEFNFPPSASVDNLQLPYIFPKNQPNRITRINETAIASLKGAKKLQPFNNAGINNFYAFPTMPNKGELERDKVQGFKEATGIKYNDFENRGNQLMLGIIKSFESINR